MTQAISDRSTEHLVDEFLRCVEIDQRAVRLHQTALGNRNLRKLIRIEEVLCERPDGRSALEALLADSRPYTRLRAASPVIKWAPNLAIPVLGRLLIEDFGETLSSSERIELRQTAKEALYFYFNVGNFDRNKLIEPLRAYGIDLPRRYRAP